VFPLLSRLGSAVVLSFLGVPVFPAIASVEDGLTALGPVEVPQGELRPSIISILIFVLTFLALAAIITIIVAGLFLILGFGTEQSAQRARKILLYTIIGLIVIFFARIIVGFFTGEITAIIN
jgi:lysylphosphatidylglycerol synthetase-like protein (DUF2156 family)